MQFWKVLGPYVIRRSLSRKAPGAIRNARKDLSENVKLVSAWVPTVQCPALARHRV